MTEYYFAHVRARLWTHNIIGDDQSEEKEMSKRKVQFKKVSGVSRTKEVPVKVTSIMYHSTFIRHYNAFIWLSLTFINVYNHA